MCVMKWGLRRSAQEQAVVIDALLKWHIARPTPDTDVGTIIGTGVVWQALEQRCTDDLY